LPPEIAATVGLEGGNGDVEADEEEGQEPEAGVEVRATGEPVIRD
jgi:hypothetical protein